MSNFSNTLLSGFQTGWGLADSVRDRRARADQQAFDNNMALQQQQQEEAWRQEQRDNRRQIVEERLRQQQHDRRMWSLINSPEPQPEPGIATGEGQGAYSAPKAPHAMDSITIDDAAQMSPETQRAYMTARGNRDELVRKQNEADMYIKWARANGSTKQAFFIDEKGKPSHALQTVIDAGKFDQLDRGDVHSSVRSRDLDPSYLVDYLAGGNPNDKHYQDPELERRHALFSRMDPALLEKTAASRFAYEEEVKRLTAAYANPNKPESQAALAASNAPMPRAQASRGTGATSGTKTALGALYGRMAKALDDKPDQEYSRKKFVLAQAAALMGHSLPDGSVVLNAGDLNAQGFIEIVHPDGKTEDMDPAEFERRYGGGAAQGGGSIDPNALYEQISAEMPDATDEELAAELDRRMNGG